MLSDILDGYLARKWNLVSPAGAYLDPLADKLMVATTLIMLIPLGWAPAWLVALIICRESAITGLRGIASQEGMVISASTLGKLKTAYQSTAIGFILWHVDITWFEGGPVLHTANAGLVLLYLGTLFSLLSAAEYLIQFFRLSAAVVRERAQSGS
jgi:CDP-diacylglycerol--glycerol-3-phosphate 3-phosphatidyltransferase